MKKTLVSIIAAGVLALGGMTASFANESKESSTMIYKGMIDQFYVEYVEKKDCGKTSYTMTVEAQGGVLYDLRFQRIAIIDANGDGKLSCAKEGEQPTGDEVIDVSCSFKRDEDGNYEDATIRTIDCSSDECGKMIEEINEIYQDLKKRIAETKVKVR